MNVLLMEFYIYFLSPLLFFMVIGTIYKIMEEKTISIRDLVILIVGLPISILIICVWIIIEIIERIAKKESKVIFDFRNKK